MTVYDNPLLRKLNHHVVRMNEERCGTFDEAALDAVLELREILLTLLADQKEAPQAKLGCRLNRFLSRTCELGTDGCEVQHNQPASAEKWDPSHYGMPDAKPSAEKPQPVATDLMRRESELFNEHCRKFNELEGPLVGEDAIATIKRLVREIAEARTAAREEALREVRGLLQRDYGPSEVRILLTNDIDDMLARLSAEVPK